MNSDQTIRRGNSSQEFKSIFVRLRAILQPYAGTLTVSDDSDGRYCLEGTPGSATLAAWGGKLRRPSVPVAWVEIGKAYVSYHLMPLYGNSKLHDGMSKELRSRMQGKTCLNFKRLDEELFKELERLTATGLAAFRKAGYVSDTTQRNAIVRLR
jgi:hypothetical protein